VLRRACRDLKRLQARAGRPLRMSVNLSPVQLEDDDLIGDVARTLAENDVEPGSLTLEITETALMGDARRSVEVLSRLKQLGVRLAIDDFGTGYSS
jgi:EAL domain-containing protein (putative c-di-GMP-specific phosphodiesterase class I)